MSAGVWLKKAAACVATAAFALRVYPVHAQESLNEASSNEAALAQIEMLVDRAHFEAAERETQNWLASGKLDRFSLARAHLQLGIIAAARGRAGDAELEFERALRLDANLRLPPTAGPHVVQTYQKTQRELSNQPSLDVAVAAQQIEDADEAHITTRITGGDGLAYDVRVSVPGAPSQTYVLEGAVLRGAEPLRLRLSRPRQLCDAVVVELRDVHGNRLLTFQEKDPVCPRARDNTALRMTRGPAPAAKRLTKVAPPEDAIPTQVWVGVIVTANLLVATSSLGFVALSERAAYHQMLHDPQRSPASTWKQRERALDAANRATLVGVGALAAATASLALYLFRPPSSNKPPNPPPTQRAHQQHRKAVESSWPSITAAGLPGLAFAQCVFEF